MNEEIIHNSCPNCVSRRDCDSDLDNYCLLNESCPYQTYVKDCGGDYIALCRK